MTQEFCREHQELKACTKGVITWPKFVTILISIIVIAITITGMVTTALSKSIDKIETDSKERDSDIVKTLVGYMEQHIIPTEKAVSRIEAKMDRQ